MNLTRKYSMQKIIVDTYGKAVFLSTDELRTIHLKHNTTYSKNVINSIFESVERENETVVAYILGIGMATDNKHCCNGLRYGPEGAYISLPQLPATVWGQL